MTSLRIESSDRRPAAGPDSATSAEFEALLSVDQLATCLNIGRTKAWQLVYSREIRSYRVGRHVRIRPCDVRTYLEANRVK